jgi:hypothetical protein
MKRAYVMVAAVLAVFSTIIGAMFVLTSSVVSTHLVKAQEPVWQRDTKLQADDVYFLAGADDNTEDNIIPITATLYLTNGQWNSSGNVKIVAYLLRTSPSIGVDKSTVEAGTIAGSTTKEIDAQLVVPGLDTSYDVEFLIFENDLLVLHGQGNIEIFQIQQGSLFRNYVQVNTAARFEKVN